MTHLIFAHLLSQVTVFKSTFLVHIAVTNYNMLQFRKEANFAIAINHTYTTTTIFIVCQIVLVSYLTSSGIIFIHENPISERFTSRRSN